MKALFITIDYPPAFGGVAEYLSRLVEHMPAEVDVVVIAPKVLGTREEKGVLRRTLLFRWIRPRWLPALFWSMWYCMRLRPDVLVVSHVVPIGMIARWCKKLFAIPYVVITHGMDVALVRDNRGRKHRQARAVLDDAALVTVNSSVTQHMVTSLGVTPEKIFFLPPSPTFSQEELRVAEECREATRRKYGVHDTIFILSVCRLVERKNISMVLEAIGTFSGKKINYSIVGDGARRATLESLIATQHLEDRARCLGAISRDELVRLYGACDMFVLAPKQIGTDIEGFGTVYLEANMFGKPVIGSRSGGVVDAVIDGVNGLLVEENDVAGLTAAMHCLVDDNALRRRLGAQGKERVLQEFGWTKWAQKFAERLLWINTP